MAANGFAKVVVRAQASIVEAAEQGASATTSALLARRSTSAAGAYAAAAQAAAKAAKKKAEQEANRLSSGLKPLEVLIFFAAVTGLFIALLIVGELCKIFNKPRKEAAPYAGSQKLYQPSAAGYGSRAATQAGNNTPQGKGYGSRMSLLDGASPMGMGGRADEIGETTLESISGVSNGSDYFGRSPAMGHSRGQSSGVQLPGAATVVNPRRGNGAHPTLNGGAQPFGPDGSGFKPGQPVNLVGAYSGPRPSFGETAGGPVPGQQGVPAHARIGLGRPPASDARRKSRYSRAMSRRIDSMGPTQLRKSVYLGADDDPMNPELYVSRRSRMIRKPSQEDRSTDTIQSNGGGAGLRRIDSLGKGEGKRKSNIQSFNRASRAMSYYNAKGNDRAAMLSAQAENFGAGRGDPLGARNLNLDTQDQGANRSPYLANPSLNVARGRSPSGSSPGLAGQHSPISPVSPLPSPGLSNGQPYGLAPSPRPGPAMMPMGNGAGPMAYPPNDPRGLPPQQQSQQQQQPMAYPGGGAPRIRPRQGYGMAPVQAAGGYDRSGRQVL